MEEKCFTIALAGNPNSGKTTIFNSITGTRQKVGNWPGVTVEKKEGSVQKSGYKLNIVDLPGTYSLTPFSIEEIVARDFVIEQNPDVVINIIDASNLERSLYLATQIRELDCKVLFALNMEDIAKQRGIKIDGKKLSRLLNLPVVFTVGNKNQGIDTLLEKAILLAKQKDISVLERRVKYSKDIEQQITTLKNQIDDTVSELIGYKKRWLAIKLIENDEMIKKKVIKAGQIVGQDIIEQAGACRKRIVTLYNDDPEIIMTDERYGFIAGIIKEVVTTSRQQRVDISRNIDLVLTNKFLGFPVFIFFIWAMFQITFTLGAYPMDWIGSCVSLLSGFMGQIISDGLFKDLLIDGIISGVGSVAVFLPNILILFFCIALFEDTGYMARAAFLMDRIMHVIGLHGKSFIPMLMGFGCNVPAIMATRTLESKKDRILTILITPFMSCSARLPVFIILAGTFFHTQAGTVIFLLYLLGITMAIITGRIFRMTLLKGEDAPFVMELPPYRMPMLKSLVIHMWDRSKMFLKKMGGVILIGSIVIWSLSTFPLKTIYSIDYDKNIKDIKKTYAKQLNTADKASVKIIKQQYKIDLTEQENAKSIEKTESSYLSRLGKFFAPLFEPIGIKWRGTVALISGFVAKEVVISTISILYNVSGDEPDALSKALKLSMTPLSAFVLMVFVLLYVPCIAAVVAIGKETGSYYWAFFSVAYTFFVAWVTSFVVYRIGLFAGYC